MPPYRTSLLGSPRRLPMLMPPTPKGHRNECVGVGDSGVQLHCYLGRHPLLPDFFAWKSEFGYEI